ncbi:hypothetical protein F4861DRAFT_544335 [Xylaria intraflava]|nr:hypothetical protein F4861DRAFT_544335 [Xylaria intraflava]
MSGTEDDRIHTRSMTAGRSAEPSTSRADAQGQGQSNPDSHLGDELQGLATRLRLNHGRSQSQSPNLGPNQEQQSRDSSRGRAPSSRGSRATPRSRSHADSEQSWEPDEGGDNGSVLPEWARQLMQRQTELIETLATANTQRPRGEDNSKVPHYNCKRLVQDASAAEIEDWITAIKEGNQQKPGRSDTVHVMAGRTG